MTESDRRRYDFSNSIPHSLSHLLSFCVFSSCYFVIFISRAMVKTGEMASLWGNAGASPPLSASFRDFRREWSVILLFISFLLAHIYSSFLRPSFDGFCRFRSVLEGDEKAAGQAFQGLRQHCQPLLDKMWEYFLSCELETRISLLSRIFYYSLRI